MDESTKGPAEQGNENADERVEDLEPAQDDAASVSGGGNVSQSGESKPLQVKIG